MVKQKNNASERWRDIPGFDGAYQASDLGRIRRCWPNAGKVTFPKPYTHGGPRMKNASRRALRVKLQTPSGKWVERPVLRLIAETFIGVPDGMCAIHKDGFKMDNSLQNIDVIPVEELGKRYGGDGSRRPVVKINANGEAAAFYRSAREAARNNYMSYQAVMDRCNGKRKREFEEWEYSFRWDDG